MSNAKIDRLEAKINDIMSRPTYSSTPAWQSDVAEMRLQIEALRSGKEVERREYRRPTLDARGALVLDGPNPADDMASEVERDAEHHEANYVGIFVVLFLLTVLEWKAAHWFGIHGKVLWSALAIMAVVKAMLVALYFMHLKFERRTVYALMVLPVVLVIIMVGILFPDSQQNVLQYLNRMLSF